MRLCLSILLFLSLMEFPLANSLKIEVAPNNPVKGENFTVRFKIETNLNKTPLISFDPRRLEVLSRRSEGVSIQTVIVNGKFSTKRELIHSYEMSSERSGQSYLKNIKVKIGNETLTHKDIKIRVLSQKSRPRDIFIKAEVSKKEVFLGEGVDIRYYLYTKVPIVGAEIKKFPSLNKMIKRFHHVNEREEAVNYQGTIYRRGLKYSARVYPERVGKVYADPLRLRIQYQKRRRQKPFGNFGFSFGGFTTKTIQNKKVTIEVKPLPAESVPSNFTGLVGKHNFKISQVKNKYLVNEAIELRMEVSGPGALENLEAPIIYSDNKLEKFDTKSEIIETGKSTAKKILDYTYLARAPVIKNPSTIKLSYFNPEKLIYEEVEMAIPGIQVEGTAITGARANLEASDEMLKREDRVTISETKELKKTYLVAPVFEISYGQVAKIRGMKWLMISLIILIFIQLVEFCVSHDIFLSRKKGRGRGLYNEIKKNGLTYSKLYSLLILLDSEKTDLSFIVSNSSLKEESKKYFLNLVNRLEKGSFGQNCRETKVSMKSIYFKELLGVLDNGNS